MADELDNFVSALATALEAVTWIKDAPEYPLEAVNEFPVAMIYFVRGKFDYSAGRGALGYHTVHADVLLGRSVLPHDEQQARPFILRMLAKVADNVKMDGTCEHCLLTDYMYGGIQYTEQSRYFGIRFVLDVKIKHSGITVTV